MDFTQYSQILSYIQSPQAKPVLDIMGQTLPSTAGHPVNLRESHSRDIPSDHQFDVMLFRFALSLQYDPFSYLSGIMEQLAPQGIVILQDYVLPDDEQVADYINGLIHILDTKHVKSFAQYAWNGLLLDVGLSIQNTHHRSIKMTIQQWIENNQLNNRAIQQAQVMLVQAPSIVGNILQLDYPETPYAEFELQEIVCIAQKES